MRVLQLLAYSVFATSVANTASLPDSKGLSILVEHGGSVPRSADVLAPENAIEKRKGGGGRGGGGGGGKGGGSKGGSTPARAQPNSNLGGSTRLGSGPPRAYGGAYGGGSSVPYKAGTTSTGRLNPGLLLFPVAALAIFPGLWLWSVWPYHLNHYRFYNESYRNGSQRGQNQSLPVVCLCQEYSVCGCDNNNDTQYLNALVGNGSYDGLNKSLVTVADVNGTRSLVINGTLPNGTTAPGGEDAANALTFGKYSGYWLMGMLFLYAAILL